MTWRDQPAYSLAKVEILPLEIAPASGIKNSRLRPSFVLVAHPGITVTGVSPSSYNVVTTAFCI